MSKITWFLILLLPFTIWRVIRSFGAIKTWHKINAHAGKAKQPLPANILAGPVLWGGMMIACSMALVVHGTMVYYADESYDTFDQMVPVYPGAQPLKDGLGTSPSIDQKILIVEYAFSDPWEAVVAHYNGGAISEEWRLTPTRDAGNIFLEHQNGSTLYISWSEHPRYKEKGQRILKYTLFKKDLK